MERIAEMGPCFSNGWFVSKCHQVLDLHVYIQRCVIKRFGCRQKQVTVSYVEVTGLAP